MSQKIIVIGSSNVDFIMKMERLPKIGETITNAQFMQTFGGKGANQAVGGARAGGEIWLVNCVGDDAFAQPLLENMRQAGIHVEHVYEEKGITSGAALVMIGDNGDNYLSVSPGANYRLSSERVNNLGSLLDDAAIVMLQYEILADSLYAAIDMAYDRGIPVMFNLAPARAFDQESLKKIEYLIVNRGEAESLCGFSVSTTRDVDQAADWLLGKGAKTVVITLGSEGVFLAGSDGRMFLPAFKVQAIDSTGAGDIFCGALAVALVEGKTLKDAARFACAAAAICVTRLGAQPSAPSRVEIDQFLLSQDQ